MIEDATLQFVNGNTVGVDRAKFLDSGWLGVSRDGDWTYYPPRMIARVVSYQRDEEEEGSA
jgi:hypothetical protein